MVNFHDLENAMREWPTEVPETVASGPHIHQRLARALRSFGKDPESVGRGDLAGLIRQLLRWESLERGRKVEIEVPATEDWPSRREWERFGVDVRFELEDSYQIRACEWSPLWVEGDLTDDFAVQEIRRAPACSDLPADPLIKQDLNIDNYRSPGQAGALRAMSLLPAGQCLVIGLPTGSGKSLVFQAAVIQAGRRGELVVIVVPTTALAMDQEARMQEVLNHALTAQAANPMAYHSGLSAEDKRAFRQRLKRGEQSVVIGSPEAVLGALRFTLQTVARQGRLAWLAIDEAHMVSQWGDTFRPEFQFLAASIAGWREVAPKGKTLRTLLLTATLTDDGLDTLRTLFSPRAFMGGVPTMDAGERDGFHVLAALELRSEPEYWVVDAPDETSRHCYVIEAIRHLPRPLIVYTTTRENAESLFRSLREDESLKRVALFRGGDAATARGAKDLQRWNAGDLDIVVATSAFGLGMDNSDVRAVIHACVPETVDRFYQEVGRGGRDGCAALSLWVHTPKDMKIAEGLAKNRLISLKRGWERWDQMRVNAKLVPQFHDAWSVRLDDKPSDLWEENEANRGWNLRTLLLMARAGLIALGIPQIELPEPAENESEADYDKRCQNILFEAYGRTVVIERVAITREAWNDAIFRAKKRASARDEEDQRRLKQLVAVERPFNEVFAETYTITLGNSRVDPTPFAGQCPITREQRDQVGRDREPTNFVCTNGLLADLEESVNLPEFAHTKCHWISYVQPENNRRGMRTWNEQINKLLRRLVHGGFVEVAIPEARGTRIDVNRLLRDSLHSYVVIRRLDETDPFSIDGLPTELPLPRVTILPPTMTCGREIEKFLDLQRPMHVIVIPNHAMDPDRDDRPFVATRRYHDRLERLVESWSL